MNKFKKIMEDEISIKAKIPCNESNSIIRLAQINGSYTWTIYNFSFSIDKEEDAPTLASPMFALGSTNEFKWDLNVYPLGSSSKHSDYISAKVYFYDHDDFDEVLVECEISIINDKGEKLHTAKTDSLYNLSKNDMSWEKEDFIKRDHLMNESNGLLINDKLTLLCKIYACGYYERKNEDKNLITQISKCRLHFSQDMKKLLNGELHDVILISQNTKFHVHKSVLATRSKVFSAMFEHQMLEQTNNSVVISDLSPESLKELVQYIYTGNINDIEKLPKEILTELLVAADKYELNDLKEMCEIIFFNHLTLSNAVETLIFADFHNAEKLIDQTINFIAAHNKEFINNQAFQNLSTTHSHLLPKFIVNARSDYYSDSLNDSFYGSFIDANFSVPIVKNTSVEGKCWGVTQILVDECTYTWKINNFGFFLKTESTETSIVSQMFTKNENEFSWQLVLYPRGINDQMKDYISLYIRLFSESEKKVEVQACYEFSIINNKNEKTNIFKSDLLIFIANGERLGNDTFLKKDLLLNNPEELLNNDTLTIMCKVTSNSNSNCRSITQKDPMNFCTPKYELNVSIDHEKLLETGKFSDIILSVSGKEFRVHRALLSVRCPTLLNIIDLVKKEEENDKIIQIPNSDPQIFKELLLFIYSGKVENLKVVAKELYSEASKYGLDDLKSICESFLCKRFTINNVCDTFVFAHLNKACQLQSKAIQFIVNNLKLVMETPGYKSMIVSRPQLLTYIFYELHA